jgi:hypothetical protein
MPGPEAPGGFDSWENEIVFVFLGAIIYPT